MNPLARFKSLMGTSPDVAQAAVLKRPPLSYKRTSLFPSYKMKGKEVIPTEKREYYDDNGIVQSEEKPSRVLQGTMPVEEPKKKKVQ